MAPQPGNDSLDCRAYQGALDAYFHGHLTAEERAAHDAHATGCAACARVLGICDELSCQEFVAFLDAFVAGELSPARREVFDWHLAICPDCQNYLDSYQKTIELGREALRGSDEVAVPADLVRAILDARRNP